MQKVKVEDAVGMILAHDLTKIVPGEFKGVAFKKGHIIKEEDIEALKNMGKNHVYILVLSGDELHEDEAAIRMGKAAAGKGIDATIPSEGKVSLKAKYKGLLKIDTKSLGEINEIDMIMLATLHNNTVVEKEEVVAATRIIPLVIDKERIEKVENICSRSQGVICIKPMHSLKTGIVVTGSEVYHGRITDKFGPILKEKIKHYGAKFIGLKYAPDEPEIIEEKILELIKKGAEVILASGGMSVDADDVTPTALKQVATDVISYGSPVLPGAMFMVAYKEDVTILGIPGCGMYHRTTVFDLIYPRVLAGERLSKKDIVTLAHGGLCRKCEVCNYPICPLGK